MIRIHQKQKGRLVGVLLGMFIFSGVNAQLTYGPRAGFNLSSESVGNNDYSTSPRAGFYGGLFGNYRVKGPLGLEAELLYSAEGTREKYKPTGQQGDISRGFLRVPVLIQYIPESGLYAETGPQAGILLSSKEKFDGVTSDIKPYYHGFSLAWCIGLGYRPEGSMNGWGINFRYSFGLTSLNSAPDIAGKSLRPTVFSAGLLYAFPRRDL